MNLDLFGQPVPPATKKIFIRSIEARYRNEVVRDDAPEWVSKRFTQPQQVFEMFRDLRHKTKEHFIALHLDGKNRIVCFDPVSIGSKRYISERNFAGGMRTSAKRRRLFPTTFTKEYLHDIPCRASTSTNNDKTKQAKC